MVFAVASLVTAVVLVSLVAIPQWLSKQARWESLRSHVAEIGEVAASVIDGDLHRRLLDPKNYSQTLYREALKTLVRFHSADPSIFYVYTMANLSDGVHFILDTAASPDLKTSHKLQASPYMEKFELRKEAAREERQGPAYFEVDNAFSKSITAFWASFGENARSARLSGDQGDRLFWSGLMAEFGDYSAATTLAPPIRAVVYLVLHQRLSVDFEERMRQLGQAPAPPAGS